MKPYDLKSKASKFPV